MKMRKVRSETIAEQILSDMNIYGILKEGQQKSDVISWESKAGEIRQLIRTGKNMWSILDESGYELSRHSLCGAGATLYNRRKTAKLLSGLLNCQEVGL